jgi:hypothetical protein
LDTSKRIPEKLLVTCIPPPEMPKMPITNIKNIKRYLGASDILNKEIPPYNP